MFYLKILNKLITLLHSDASPTQMAWGFALGTVLGFTPFVGVHTILLICMLCIFRVNLSAALFAWALYSALAWILDPLFHSLGFLVLTQIPFLIPLWTKLYNLPLAPLTRFNNTVLMGSLVFSLILFLPHYFGFKWFVQKYRKDWHPHIEKLKIVHVFKASKIAQWYFKIQRMEG